MCGSIVGPAAAQHGPARSRTAPAVQSAQNTGRRWCTRMHEPFHFIRRLHGYNESARMTGLGKGKQNALFHSLRGSQYQTHIHYQRVVGAYQRVLGACRCGLTLTGRVLRGDGATHKSLGRNLVHTQGTGTNPCAKWGGGTRPLYFRDL